jgi:Family of unknown function (DUF6328)
MPEPADPAARSETGAEQADRNFDELLQELRVAQTGVQILFAFLLSIAFQTRFQSITSSQRVIYVVSLMFAAASSVLLIAPVAIHRLLFRKHRKAELVRVSSRLALTGLGTLMASMVSAVVLILMEVTSTTVTWVLAAALAVLFLGCWVALPLVLLQTRPDPYDAGAPADSVR